MRSRTSGRCRRRRGRRASRSDVVLQRLGTAHHRPCAAQPLRVVRVATDKRHQDGTPVELVLVTNRLDLDADLIALAYRYRWTVGVSSQGSLTQSVQVRPRPRDSGLVAREAPGRESHPVKPSDNTLCKESAQRSRLQRAVNAAVASLHASPVAEPVYYVRRQQGPGERSRQRRSSPAGYQRRQGAKGERATGEVRGVRRRKLAAEAWPITVRGKWLGWPRRADRVVVLSIHVQQNAWGGKDPDRSVFRAVKGGRGERIKAPQ